MGVRGDLRMLEMAVRRRWNINTDAAANTVNELLSSSDERIRARAAAIASVMEGQNQKDEHKIIDVNLQYTNDRVSKIAAELGIDPALIVDAEGEASPGIKGDTPA